MEKVGLRPWCGQPSDRGRLKIRSDQTLYDHMFMYVGQFGHCAVVFQLSGDRQSTHANVHFGPLQS